MRWGAISGVLVLLSCSAGNGTSEGATSDAGGDRSAAIPARAANPPQAEAAPERGPPELEAAPERAAECQAYCVDFWLHYPAHPQKPCDMQRERCLYGCVDDDSGPHCRDALLPGCEPCCAGSFLFHAGRDSECGGSYEHCRYGCLWDDTGPHCAQAPDPSPCTLGTELVAGCPHVAEGACFDTAEQACACLDCYVSDCVAAPNDAGADATTTTTWMCAGGPYGVPLPTSATVCDSPPDAG